MSTTVAKLRILIVIFDHLVVRTQTELCPARLLPEMLLRSQRLEAGGFASGHNE
jgi:hypothetical protein